MSYPDGYYRYFDLFNREEFWEAHEALEELWRDLKDGVPVRAGAVKAAPGDEYFLRGLIVFAAAFVHVQRNNPSGCRQVLEKCVRWLDPFAPTYWGVDVDGVLQHARYCLAQLNQVPPGGDLGQYLPFMRLKPNQ